MRASSNRVMARALVVALLWVGSVSGLQSTPARAASDDLRPPLVLDLETRIPSFLGVPSWNFLAHAEVLIAPEPGRSLDEILAGSGSDPWRSLGTTTIGSFHSSEFWLRVRIELPENHEHEWAVHFASPHAEWIDAYWVRNGVSMHHERLGAALPRSSQDLDSVMPIIRFPDGLVGEHDLYLRVRSRLPTYTAISVYRTIDALLHETRHAVIPLVAFGVISGLALYNLFLFLITRQTMYLLYVVFMASTALWTVSSAGFAYVYFWPDSPEWNTRSTPVLTGVVGIASICFSIAFLSLRRIAPRVCYVLYGLMACNFMILADGVVGGLELFGSMAGPVTLATYPLLLHCGFLAWRAGIREARYYCLSWAVLTALFVNTVLALFGVVPLTIVATYGVMIGSVCEAVLLSLALASRIKQMRDELERLNGELTQSRNQLDLKVNERTRQLQDLQAELLETARSAGKAEVATDVLHNMGNALTSVTTSASVIASYIEKLSVDRLGRIARVIEEGILEPERFLAPAGKARMIPGYLDALESELERNRDEMRVESDRLGELIVHIHSVVAAQQSYARSNGVIARHRVADLVGESLTICGAARPWAEGELQRSEEPEVELETDKHRVLEILINLITNARQSMDATEERASVLQIDAGIHGSVVRIAVRDNGRGIAAADLPKIYQHGFTTKQSGSGFGLHSAANTATELGGRLYVDPARSQPGDGACFVLELPLRHCNRKE